MGGRVGIIWDTPITFSRLIEDCGYVPELVTPHLLAAPFFRRPFSCIIIPGGFAHPGYCSVLPALRATQDRIMRFVRGGGSVLVFGAGVDKPQAYDWLPCNVQYRYGFAQGTIDPCADTDFSCIVEDCPDLISVDGFFELSDDTSGSLVSAPESDGVLGPDVRLRAQGLPVLVEWRSGSGRIILTTIHEYPSRRFLTGLGLDKGETLL